MAALAPIAAFARRQALKLTARWAAKPEPPTPTGRIGVLLINLGTPDAADVGAVRRYLAQFLSDRRVVELPPLIWQPILWGAVLTTRPKKSAEAYAQVWRADGSPLAAITAQQAKALAGRFGANVLVDFAMRYGRPGIATRIGALRTAGCDRILIAPLYPQYCAATTATANDAVFETLAAMRRQPAIRTLPPYYADPAYIAALKASVETQLATLEFKPQALVASFHGMPQRTADLGDPYYRHCHDTARRLAQALDHELIVAFQSRFGRAEWLGPATDDTLAALPGKGVRRVAVFAPGFAADCLETLEEMALRGRDTFLAAGGEQFAYLPCLNASTPGIDMLVTLLARELEGWRTDA